MIWLIIALVVSVLVNIFFSLVFFGVKKKLENLGFKI